MKIIGHQKQWRILKNAYSAKKLSHAYLFSGPRGIGKKSFALQFAKLIFCEDRKKAPCENCLQCRQVENQLHPDLFFIFSEEGKEIQVERVRELRTRLSFKPFAAAYKIAFIDSAHLMNLESQNCLLKTLEEPLGQTIIFLITEKPHSLLPTVLSRLQEIKFFPVSDKKLTSFLEEAGISLKAIKAVVPLSNGSPAKALYFSQNKKAFEKEKKQRQAIQEILKQDLALRFQAMEKLAKNYSCDTLLSWVGALRKELLQKIEKEEETKVLRNNIKALEKTIYLLSRYHLNKRLALDNLMLSLNKGD